MVKAKTSQTPSDVPASRAKATARTQPKEALIGLRIKELDREFARQTKQLTALTKKLGKKLNQPISFNKKSKN
jgi:chaperonin cofactor prefoldin